MPDQTADHTADHTANYSLRDLRSVAEALWPANTAESWDRVGLVTGRDDAPLRRVMLAVDAVRATVDEALEWHADALITHHPLLLRGVHTMAEDTAKGALVSSLIRGNCALLAAHTNADAPEGGVSDVFARRLGLTASEPIVPTVAARSAAGSAESEEQAGHESNNAASGIGRVGDLASPMQLRDFASHIAGELPATVSGVRVAGDPDRMITRVALCGGAGDSLLDHPLVTAADVYVTSDLRHHPAQESVEQSLASGGPALIDVSHWASESLWLQGAADRLTAALPGVEFRVSAARTDPWGFSVGATK